jgi:uncharacterized phosphosugar-binding protein
VRDNLDKVQETQMNAMEQTAQLSADTVENGSTKYERISGIAETVLTETKIKEGYVLVIPSVSGRNTVPVELALWAKENGVKVIALTSLSYSDDIQCRHHSGKSACSS